MFICSTTGANNEELKVILRVYGLIMQVKSRGQSQSNWYRSEVSDSTD